jgi:hypothetical protein
MVVVSDHDSEYRYQSAGDVIADHDQQQTFIFSFSFFAHRTEYPVKGKRQI